MITPEGLYWLASTVAQVFAALIALGGVFAVFVVSLLAARHQQAMEHTADILSSPALSSYTVSLPDKRLGLDAEDSLHQIEIKLDGQLDDLDEAIGQFIDGSEDVARWGERESLLSVRPSARLEEMSMHLRDRLRRTQIPQEKAQLLKRDIARFKDARGQLLSLHIMVINDRTRLETRRESVAATWRYTKQALLTCASVIAISLLGLLAPDLLPPPEELAGSYVTSLSIVSVVIVLAALFGLGFVVHRIYKIIEKQEIQTVIFMGKD